MKTVVTVLSGLLRFSAGSTGPATGREKEKDRQPSNIGKRGNSAAVVLASLPASQWSNASSLVMLLLSFREEGKGTLGSYRRDGDSCDAFFVRSRHSKAGKGKGKDKDTDRGCNAWILLAQSLEMVRSLEKEQDDRETRLRQAAATATATLVPSVVTWKQEYQGQCPSCLWGRERGGRGQRQGQGGGLLQAILLVKPTIISSHFSLASFHHRVLLPVSVRRIASLACPHQRPVGWGDLYDKRMYKIPRPTTCSGNGRAVAGQAVPHSPEFAWTRIYPPPQRESAETGPTTGTGTGTGFRVAR